MKNETSLAEQWKGSPLNRAFVTQKAKTCGQIHKGILTEKHEFDDELRATLEKMLRITQRVRYCVLNGGSKPATNERRI